MATVTVHPLSSGHFTMPEKFFVHPCPPNARKTVPSLSFLIQHQASDDAAPTRIIFDLGLRNPISNYAEMIRKHTESRKPLSSTPDVLQSLQAGGLGADDVDFVVLSHVHWDHIGDPAAFGKSTFVVGHGALGLLNGSLQLKNGSHSFFEADLLPLDRTIELASPASPSAESGGARIVEGLKFDGWNAKGLFPHAIDLFQDGSCFIIDAPGHLPGHINLLCKISVEPTKYVLLAGDACHDRRLLSGEKEIATWTDDGGHSCCIHADKEEAMKTIARLRGAENGDCQDLGKVMLLFAHDPVWEALAKARKWVWPGKIDDNVAEASS